MLSRICLFALLFALLVSTAWGQVTLTPKFKEGDTFKTKVTIKSNQKLTLAGQDRGSNSNSVVEQKTTIGKRDAEGKLTVTKETAVVSSEIGLPKGVKVKFDAANPDAKADPAGGELAEMILDQIKQTAKTSVALVFDKENKILSPEELKEAIADEMKRLPKKELKKGDTWEQDVKIPLGGGQFFTLKRKFTYEGETSKSTVDSTRKVHKITAVDSSVVYSLDTPAAKVTKSNLKVADSKLSMLFDAEAGRAIESNSVLHVTGTFTISSMGMDADGDLDLTMSNQTEEVK